jgi:WD40 repeat protein/transcriptional regulator with XRE-family HTH domain
MRRSSYGERDYAFGELILTLRSAIGLTQAGLSDQLGISKRAVGEWEAGSSYPKATHLKALIALAVKEQVFPVGHEVEEIRALWKAAHQKVLLDETWLSVLLSEPPAPSAQGSVAQNGGAQVGSTPPPSQTGLALVSQPGQRPPPAGPVASRAEAFSGPLLDWGDALDVPSFFGRQGELATLSEWVVQDHCRVVSVLGLGGIGKSALVVQAMRELASHFDVVLFRSLRDAPAPIALLSSCLAVLSPEAQDFLHESLERHLSRLLAELRRLRVLLVLDNLEALLEAGEALGRLRPGYEGYGQLLEQVGHTGHQSCLLLTSREHPAALRALESRRALVRSLRLSGLEASACAQLLGEHELVGSPEEYARLAALYEGNPLALSIVAETIADLFGGAISPFLSAGTILFNSITQLLQEQWERLSALEQTLLFWLATLREPVSIAELQAVQVAPLVPMQLLEAVEGLRRRSLIERGQRAGSFTLQAVVLEFVTGRLVEEASQEIVQGRLSLLIRYGLCQAQAKTYVRETQERLLVAPLLSRLESMHRGRAEVEGRLRSLLSEVRSWAEDAQGYGPANLVALLRRLCGDLRGLDLSQLALRGAYLQGVEMQDTTLARARLRECVLTEAFDAITAVAISPSGKFWATSGRQGRVWVWRENGHTLHLALQAHTDAVWAIAFSSDERTLASGSLDGSVKLWEVESGIALWSGWQTMGIDCLAFAPDGDVLASGGHDATLRLWEASLGTPLQDVPHPGPFTSLAWSPDGRLLASGDVAGTIRLWEIPSRGRAACVEILAGHSSWVRGLAFAPDGTSLASASWDGSVKLWELGEGGRLRQTLLGHTEQVQCIAWSPDGRTVASGSYDHTIRLWHGKAGSSLTVLQGHAAAVNGLAFTPDSRHLLSGSEDGTMLLWEVERGLCVRVIQGYATTLYDLDWSPDGTRLASVGSDTEVCLWEVEGRKPPRVLRGHTWTVYGVAWRPDGRALATSGWDRSIRLWDPTTGSCAQILRDLDHPDTNFFGVAWSPDGKFLACGTLLQGVRVWNVTTGSHRGVGQAHATWIGRVAWSRDGMRLVGGGEDGHVSVWEASEGTQFLRLSGHHGAVWSVVWSPDGRRLASGGGDREGGELFVWDAHSGERLAALQGPTSVLYAVTWHPVGDRLISGGSDGRLRWWDLQSGACLRVREAHQGTVQALKVSPDGSRLASCGDDGAIRLWDVHSGEPLRTLRRDRPYERLNITGIRGLTEAQKASLRALGAVEDAAAESPGK